MKQQSEQDFFDEIITQIDFLNCCDGRMISQLPSDEKLEKLSLIVYNGKFIEKLRQLIGFSSKQNLQNLVIIKNENNRHFILYRIESKKIQNHDKTLKKLIGLCLTVITYEVSNQIQATMQKSFNSTVFFNRKHSQLIYIKQLYQENTSQQHIKFFSCPKSAKNYIDQHSSFFEQPISIKELTQIYQIDEIQNISKIRYLYDLYMKIQINQKKLNQINEVIFQQEMIPSSQLQKILDRTGINSAKKAKLMWKHRQMIKYRQILQEDQIEDKMQLQQMTIETISIDLSANTVAKFKFSWTSNSLLKLKNLYRKIVNYKDEKGMKSFRQYARSMKTKLEQLIENVKSEQARQSYRQIKLQIEDFIDYHERAIEFTSLNFMIKQINFEWRYKNKRIKKIVVFILILFLAFMAWEKDMTVGFAFAVMAVISWGIKY